MTALKERLQEDQKTAMRAQAKQELGVLRLILAAVKQYEVDKRLPVSDEVLIGLLGTMLKQRRDSIAQFTQAGRQDLIDQEVFEVSVIERYLPTKLSDAEVSQLLEQALTEVAAKSMQDMGKVMAWLKPKLQGRADLTQISQKIKDRLATL